MWYIHIMKYYSATKKTTLFYSKYQEEHFSKTEKFKIMKHYISVKHHRKKIAPCSLTTANAYREA